MTGSRPLRLVFLAVLCAGAAGLLAAGPAAAAPHESKPHKQRKHHHKRPQPKIKVTAPAPAPLQAGTATTVKVRISDVGTKPLRKVKLSVKAPDGIVAAPATVKVKGTIAPHKAKTVAVTLTAATTAKSTESVSFVVTAKAARKVTRAVKLSVTPAPPSLAGRYFFRSELILNTTYLSGYYFVDSKWAYRGLPTAGLPNCTTTTAVEDKDGCLPYTYDPATGGVQIGTETGSFQPGSAIITIGSNTFSEAVIPAAGTLFQATGTHINGFGICPTSCSFVSVTLDIKSNGEFARGSAVSGTTEGEGFGVLPPDQHGTYALTAPGRITFTYADGHYVNETIAVMLNDAKQPDPNYGLVLDESAYFGPNSGV